MSDVLLIDNSILQETVLVPVTAVQPDLVTQTDVVVYVPLASKNAHGIVKIGEGLHITPDGLLSFDRSEVTIKELALNGTLLVPDENKRVNIVLHKTDVGLGNVDNTSDLDKPISTAVQNALDLLNTDLTDDILDVDDRLIVHINDFNNPHRVTKHQVGLDNVDNTSDADKPISKATQRELSRIQGLIKGGENAVSYESYEAMINDFNVLGPDVYNVGQSVFIATLKVPDLWVYGVEEEFEEFTYIDDSTIESILNIDGTLKVGYYRLAALDSLKVDLTDYVTTEYLELKLDDYVTTEDLELTLNDYVTNQTLDLRFENVAYKDDLPKQYIKDATVTNTTLTITKQDDSTVDFEGGPSEYVKSVVVTDDTLTLTDQDGINTEFKGGPTEYLKSAAIDGKKLTIINHADEQVSVEGTSIPYIGKFTIYSHEDYETMDDVEILKTYNSTDKAGIYLFETTTTRGSTAGGLHEVWIMYIRPDSFSIEQTIFNLNSFLLYSRSYSVFTKEWTVFESTVPVTKVDSELSTSSNNPVRNSVVTEALSKTIQYLGSFTGIYINGVVSDLGINLDTLTTPGTYYFKNTISLDGTSAAFYILFVSYYPLTGERVQTYFNTLTGMQSRTTTSDSFEGIYFDTISITPDQYVTKDALPKLGTTNWSVSQNSSGELVFTYTA